MRISDCSSDVCSSDLALVCGRPLILMILEALVGFDDALHQWMAHDVLGHEMRETDARHVLEHLDHMVQPGFGATGQVDLGDVPGDDRGGAEDRKSTRLNSSH